MTVMIDTTGREHTIVNAANVRILRTIGWTVKAATTDTTVTTRPIPRTEGEWDAEFGRR